MLTRKTMIRSAGRGLVMATAAALLLTSVELSAARAESAPHAKSAAATVGTSTSTDFSAARRRYRNNNAAAAAVMGMFLGTMGTIIAEQQRRDYYDSYYAPRYYGGYAPGYAYGPGYGYGVVPYPYRGRRLYTPY